MAGNVPATLLRDLHAIAATCHDALEQGVEGNLKRDEEVARIKGDVATPLPPALQTP